MSDIARLGVVVEQSGIETTLKGLDAIAAKMKAIETNKVSPVSTPKGGSTATASLAKEEFKLTAFKEKEAEKRLTVAEKSAAKEKDIALKINSAKEIIEARTAAYRKVLADKAESEAIKHNQQMAFIHKRSQDGILRIEEKTKADILKIREKADSDLIKQSSKLNNDLVRMSTAQSLRIAEQEAKNASNLSAISRKELDKQVTEQSRARARIETEKAKSATRIEQIEAANQAKIQQIRERTAAYAEKLQMREELAARRSIEQQGKAYSSLADIANKARNVMAVAFAGYGITEAVGAVIKTADAMTELNARLRLVTQSSAELKQVQMDLFRVSQSSGTSIKDNSEIYFGLARATKTLGTSQKDLIFLTEGLGKAAIVSGASTQSFKAAMFQLRQALESGVLRGQEFNSISEQAPRVLQAIGEGLGKTTGELRKMAGQGQLTTDVVLPALMKGLQSVNKEFDSLPTTVSRATTMVENSFSMLVARANEASKGTSTLAEVIKNISSAMDSISTDSITTTMNAAGYAVMGLALVLSGKLIQALGAAAIAKVASTKADMAMVRSNATVAASELQKAQAASVAAAEKVRAAAMGVEAANAAVAAAERVVLAEEASRMSMLKTLAAREALTAAQAKAAAASQASVAATTAMTASNNAAATAADAHAVAQARLAAAGTATGRVMSGLGAVFNAMGGWVTVAIGVIWGLVTVWNNVANAAENAARKQKEAVMRGKASENIAGVTKEENEALSKVEKATVNAKKLEAYLNELERSGKSKTDNEVKTVQSLLDKERAAITGWRSAAIQLENERKSKTAALQSTIANNIQDENAGYEKIVKNYQDSVKFKSDKQRQMDDLKEIDRQADDALSKLYKKPSVEDVRLGLYNSDKVAKAAAEIERTRSEQRKLVMEKYAKKEGGAKKPKSPELSAGYEAALSYTQEQLEVINKMASAQEKLLGYIKPELLERKQSLEAEKERENTVAKIAKIQEQLNKKNLGKGVAGQLQEQLKIYQQQKDAISQELVVTQALQREQNNLKIYEMDVLRIAQQKNELQKAYLDAAMATGSLSGQEAKQQEQLNALKMIEIEYAGKIIEAQKTYDLMVKNRYTEEAEASKLRLDSLISERDTKLEVAKIKMYSDQEARTFEAGWRRAWGTYKDEASNASSFGEKVMGDALKGIEDAFYAMMSGTKFSFKDLWKSILSDMNRYFARQITATLGDAIASAFSFIPSSLNFTANGQGLSVQGSQSSAGLPQITGNSTGSMLSNLATNAGRMLGFNTNPISAQSAALFTEGSQAIYGFTDSVVQSTGVIEGALNSISSNATLVPSWQYGLAGVGGGMVGGFVGDEVFGGKGYASSGGSMGGSIGTSLALASGAGPLGIAAGLLGGSLLGGGLGSLFGDKKPDERKAKFGYGASDALREEGKTNGWTGSSEFGDFRTYNDQWFSGSEMGAAMGQYIDSLEALDKTVADSLKLTADQTANAIDALKAIDKEYSFGLQWGDFTQNSKAREQIAIDRYSTILDSVESGWGDFVRGFTGSFDQFPAFLQSIIQAMQQFRDAGGDVTRVFGQQVNSIKEFERFAKSGETSAAAFQRLYGVFQITNRVLESLGKSTKGANLATADLRENFVRLAGGMEQLQGYLTEYYEGFYTEAERTAVVMADLQKEFDKYGATVPKTREEWRKLNESLDLSTESGQQAAVKLYQLQGAFLSITPEIESATEAAKDFKDEIADLEQYFRDQLNAVDYSGMTEQGQQAASVLDELTSKLARLSEIGGDVDLGVQAISRYIKTEIPKLYADALAPFKQAGGRGYTDLGKNIFGLFGAAQEANKGIAEISSQEQSAIIKASTITKVIAKDVPIAIEDSIAAIKKIDFMSMVDPAGELAKQAFGRDATAQERAAIDEAYQWGIANGKSLDAIVSDIVDHALRFDEALQFLGSKTKTQYEDIKIVDTEQSAAMQASAAIKKANATAELLSGFIDAVYDQVNSAFTDVIKESSMIGLGDLARSARENRITLENRLQSVVETVSATASGMALAGGVDVTAKAKSLVDAFINGGIQTGDDLASAVESVFAGAGVDSVKNQLKEAALASAKLQVDSSKNLIEQLITPWQDLVDQQSFNEIDLSTMRAIKARDQALKDAADLANEIGYGFEQMSGEINRGFAAQMLDITKQKLRSVTDSINKIADFQAGIDDAIFGLRVGMSGADVSRLYAQRQAEIKAQLDAAMQGDNLDEQIGLANKLRETITQRYAAEQQAQERMMSFARGLGDYLRQLRTSDKSTGSIYDRLTEAQKQFAEDVALSRGTGAEAEAARGRVTSTSDTVLDLARQFYANGEGYQQIYNSVVGGLEGLQIDTRTESERQIDAINDGNSVSLRQIDELKQVRSIFDFRLSTLIGQQVNYNTQLQKFTAAMLSGNDRIAQLTASLGAYTAAQIGAGQLAVEQHIGNLSQQISAQISAVNTGIATHVSNLSQQIGQINGVILQALSQHISALSSSTASQISALHQAIANTASNILAAIATHAGNLHQTVVSTGSNVNNWLSVAMGNNTQSIIGSILAEGIATRLAMSAHASTLNSTISAITNVNGSHADGLSHVPFDGYVAELHKGEMVLDANTSDALRKYGVNVKYSQDQMKAMMQPANDDASKQQLIQEVKRLNASLEKLRQEVALQGQSDRQQRGEIASRQEGMQKQQIVSTMRLTASSI